MTSTGVALAVAPPEQPALCVDRLRLQLVGGRERRMSRGEPRP